MIKIVSYGMGNIRSILNSVEYLGYPVAVAETPAALDDADKIIVPGVGAFGEAMRRLTDLGFRDALEEQVQGQGKPVLGICLGMQLFADFGTEFGDHAGFAWIPGRVEKIPRALANRHLLRLPHVGWNALRIVRDTPLFDGLDGEASCYFVHTYAFQPAEAAHIVATVEYGTDIVAAVARDNIFGVQFHPEKSQAVGLHVLSAFATLP